MGVVYGPLMARGVRSSDQSSLQGEVYFSRLEEIPEVAVWSTHPGSDRQHHGDAVSKQDRRDQVQVLGLEGSGDYSLVSEHEDYIAGSTYLRTGQCRGRSPLSFNLRILDGAPTEWSRDHTVTNLLFDI